MRWRLYIRSEWCILFRTATHILLLVFTCNYFLGLYLAGASGTRAAGSRVCQGDGRRRRRWFSLTSVLRNDPVSLLICQRNGDIIQTFLSFSFVTSKRREGRTRGYNCHSPGWCVPDCSWEHLKIRSGCFNLAYAILACLSKSHRKSRGWGWAVRWSENSTNAWVR